jgi:large subunit ribosomal protein L10
MSSQQNKAHVSESKKKTVNELKKLLQEYRMIGVADLRNLPSKQFQLMKSNLKSKMKIFVTKKRLVKLALKDIMEKRNLSGLLPYVEKSMPAIILSNEEPFTLYNEIKKSKSKAPAKPGQISPAELVLHAGPTEFPPGPIIGELGQLGIIAAVENGKVCVKREKILAKKGEVITEKIAQLLSKVGIEPMEIGLNVLCMMSEGVYYQKEVLDVDEEKLREDIISAHRDAFFLALSSCYLISETITPLVQKAAREGKSLSSQLSEKGIVLEEGVAKKVAAAEKEAVSLHEHVHQEHPNNEHHEHAQHEHSHHEHNQPQHHEHSHHEHTITSHQESAQSPHHTTPPHHETSRLEISGHARDSSEKDEVFKESEVAKNILESLKDKDLAKRRHN